MEARGTSALEGVVLCPGLSSGAGVWERPSGENRAGEQMRKRRTESVSGSLPQRAKGDLRNGGVGAITVIN